MHVWHFDEYGRPQRWLKEWTYTDDDPWQYEVEDLGVGKTSADKIRLIKLSKDVTEDRLKHDERWTKRMEFLQAKMIWDNKCLYTQDGILDRIDERCKSMRSTSTIY